MKERIVGKTYKTRLGRVRLRERDVGAVERRPLEIPVDVAAARGVAIIMYPGELLDATSQKGGPGRRRYLQTASIII